MARHKHEHVARLYRAIASEWDGCFKKDGWQTVLYPLQMAASLEDVYADAAYVDASQSVVYCSTVAHYEAAKSEMACKYVAGLSSFTFLWLAYEATVRLTRPDVLRKLLREEKFGERGRRLFEEYAGEFPEISGATRIARLAEGLCERGNLFDERLEAIRAKYAKRDMVFSAELVREFRNFIVHGEDKVPDHEAWHYGRNRGEATARVRRFYAIGRLILVLIQSFACAGLCGEGKEIEYGEDDTGLGSLRGDPKLVLAGLHLLDG